MSDIETYSRIMGSIAVQDHEGVGEVRGQIQWKGTDVCIDLHCECGHHGHFDGEFFYYFECPACKAKYAVGCCVKLIPLNDEQIAYVEKESRFNTCELEDRL